MTTRYSDGIELIVLVGVFSGNPGWTTSEPTKRLPSGRHAIHVEGPVPRSFHPVSMPTDDSLLGRCPDCGDPISDAWLLVEYSEDDGTDGVWAECPSCEDVVAPE
jgi:hypothetical protein